MNDIARTQLDRSDLRILDLLAAYPAPRAEPRHPGITHYRVDAHLELERMAAA